MIDTVLITASLLSFVLAVVTSPIVAKVYRLLGWVDDPSVTPHPKKTHARPIPRGGGLVIFLAVAIPALILLPLTPSIFMILLAALMIMILGVYDDVRDMNPLIRLPLLFGIAALPVLVGVSIPFVSNPFGEGVLFLDWMTIPVQVFGISFSIKLFADLLAVVWIVWTMTIVNWSKGLDGQMPGFVAIAAIVIGVLSLRFVEDPAQLPVIVFAAVVTGAFLGFLIWNWYPQTLMAGYGAGSLAGFFLAILSMLSGAKLATALLVLAIPTVDGCLVIIRRVLQKKSPFSGDRGHLHHRLIDMGWGRRRVAVFYWITTLILGMLALQLSSEQKVYTIIGLFLLVVGFITWVTLFISSSRRSDPVSG